MDREALNDLLNMMRNNKENIGYVLRFMAHKIQSPHELEALKALEALELLVQRGDRKFIEEVGKNRFLNELIKLISPKVNTKQVIDSSDHNNLSVHVLVSRSEVHEQGKTKNHRVVVSLEYRNQA